MKKTLILIALILNGLSISYAQHSCCMSSKEVEVAMVSDPSFIAAHMNPLPLNYAPNNGGMITFDVPDGKKANAFYARKENSKNVIFLFHEWWGLNNYIKREAEQLSDMTGASVFAFDLYDGAVAEKAEDASKLMEGANEERIRAIISGGIDYCGKDSRIITMGWCFGGKWSLQAAMQAGPNTVGCIMYYGFPELDKDKLGTIKFPVMGFFAKKDEWITPKVVGDFEKLMHDLKKNIVIHNYDAVHAFANPSNPNYDKVSADDAMVKSLRFIKMNFENKK